MSSSRDVSIRRQSETFGLNFVWTIDNFYLLSFAHGKPIRSPSFSLSSFRVPKYHFEFYPYGKSEEEREKHVSLFLVKSKEKEKMKNVRYACSLNAYDLDECSTTKKDLNPKTTEIKFIKRKSAFVCPFTSLPGGKLVFSFEISYESYFVAKEATNIDDLEELSSAFAKIYEESLHADSVLYSRDRRFKVHKAILNKRFPELTKNLNEDGIASISHKIDPTVTEILLRYIHSGKLDRKNFKMGFYDVASIYDLQHLKSLLFGNPRAIRASTCFNKKKISFTWRIRDFSKFNSNKTSSRLLTVDDALPWTWIKLSLHFVESGDNEGKIGFFVERYSDLCKTIICAVKVENTNKTFKHCFNNENVWNLPSFTTGKSAYLPHNEFSIEFEVSVLDGTCTSGVDKNLYNPIFLDHDELPHHAESLTRFQEDVKEILKDSESCDVTLRVGEEKIEVHKFVLCARSPVFRKMFGDPSLQRKIPEITIADVDYPVVLSMLKFMYCAEIEGDVADVAYVLGLYAASNKYEVQGLRNVCVRLLKSRLRAENAVKILLAADTWHDGDLKSYVKKFFISNPPPIILPEEWEDIKGRTGLASELLESTLSYISSMRK